MPAGAVGPLLALLSAATTAIATEDSPPSPELNTVVVTSNQLPVQTFIDRKVYTLTDDLQASFGTLSDVLADIPSVNVDPDGILSLRGDSHVLILIDGKPSPLFSGANAGENLQSFPDFAGHLVRAIRGPIIYLGLNYSFGSGSAKKQEFRYEP
jgi:outer membrane receptor protein involved in Fe transport